MWLDLGFNLAAAGTIVNGCDSFAFGSMSILDGLFRVLIHDSAAIRTTHSSPIPGQSSRVRVVELLPSR